MRLLWVTPQLPNLRTGGQVRQLHLLKELCKRNKIVLLSFLHHGEEDDVDVLRGWGIEVFAESFEPPVVLPKWINRLHSWSRLIFDSRPHFASTYPTDLLSDDLECILENFQPEIVHIETLFAAPLSRHNHIIPWVLGEQNVESCNLKRQFKYEKRLARRLWGWIESGKLEKWEKNWIARSTACLAVSKSDSVSLQRLVPNKSIVIIPNGVDAEYFSLPQNSEHIHKGLLFFGNLGYYPNIDALHYFCDEILPLVRSNFPSIQLTILGPHAPEDIVALAKTPGVDFVGFVPDVRPFLWNAAVCVSPLRSGGGTRLKILEALAAGCPSVSTTIGAEGLELEHGRNILLADSPQDFSDAITSVLQNKALAAQLAQNGQDLVSRHYDWRVLAKNLENLYSTVINKSGIQTR